MALQYASVVAQTSVDTLLERLAGEQPLSTEDARELLADCEIPALMLDRLWERAESMLDHGTEGKKLISFLKGFTRTLESGARVFEAARAKTAAANLPQEEKSKGLERLGQMSQQTAERRRRIAPLLRRLEAPPPAVDPSSLPGGRADRDAPGYIGLDELTDRLLSERDR